MTGLLSRSDELRKVIVHASKSKNIPFAHICSHLGINFGLFMSTYLNRNNLNNNSSTKVSDDDLIRVAKLLGIDIRVVIVKSDIDADSIRKKLADEYKEKRIASETKRANKSDS